MSDITETTTSTEGTSNFQSYKEDAVGRVMDKIIKEKGENAYDTNKGAASPSNAATGTNNTPSNEGASFEEFAKADINNPNFTQDQTYKGLDYNKITSELPDDAQKLLSNMRSDYTRKTQELARERKALEQQREALVKSDFAKNIKEKAETEVAFDPFDDASVQAKIEQEVAKRMQEMLNPLQKQYELQQNQMELDKFKAANPDLMTYKKDVAKLLLQNENLSLQQAYFIVKGQKQNDHSRQLEEELSSYKSQAKEYGLMIGGSSRPSKAPSVPKQVRDQGAFAVYEWLAANKSK
eukprot:GHVU01027329.1.p2 GENE.GHVU01027329.1~~GHVU01027329.1.p2  ORF type:complete len:295 (+),score=48.66 GHVU01027329.1:2022-2906(+)